MRKLTAKQIKGPWTRFMDMHSGGGSKEKWQFIYIQAPQDEAVKVFYNRFGHNPDRVSCTCCGSDYSISEEVSLKQATGFDRHCASLETPRNKRGLYKEPADPWFKQHYYVDPSEYAAAKKRGYKVTETPWRRENWKSLDEYIASPDILVIYASEIKASERTGEVPEQGYVWQG